jgi:predicted TIM-barrel fold metal-dependent hydrolase
VSAAGAAQRLIPVIAAAEFSRLPFGFLFGHAVSLLDLPGELFNVAFELLQVFVGELIPLLLDPTLHLFPDMSIHDSFLLGSKKI